MKRSSFILTLATLLFSGIVMANPNDKHLPAQPLAADGGYIVLWDCEAADFAEANTMEFDQTFVFAIDVTGTQLETWVNQPATTQGMVRGVGANLWRASATQADIQEFPGHVSRLWRIQGNIWGATYNFAQMALAGYFPTNGERTMIGIRLFGFESPLGTTCATSGQPIAGRWWVGQEGADTWMQGFTAPTDVPYFFRFPAYTGTKTDAIGQKLVNSIAYDNTASAFVDAERNVYLDRGMEAVHNYKVKYNGYASPWSTRSGACYMPYDDDIAHYNVSANPTTICAVKNQKGTVTLAGSETGVTYHLYKDGLEVSGQNKAGTGNALTWTGIEEPGLYTVWASKGTALIQMKPCTGVYEVELTEADNCCLIQGVTITVSNASPYMSDTITVRADITGTNDGNKKAFA